MCWLPENLFTGFQETIQCVGFLSGDHGTIHVAMFHGAFMLQLGVLDSL